MNGSIGIDGLKCGRGRFGRPPKLQSNLFAQIYPFDKESKSMTVIHKINLG